MPYFKNLPAGTVVGTTDTQTLTNKSLTSPTITGSGTISAASVITSGNITTTNGTSSTVIGPDQGGGSPCLIFSKTGNKTLSVYASPNLSATDFVFQNVTDNKYPLMVQCDGGLLISDLVPSNKTGVLYNASGVLHWDGKASISDTLTLDNAPNNTGSKFSINSSSSASVANGANQALWAGSSPGGFMLLNCVEDNAVSVWLTGGGTFSLLHDLQNKWEASATPTSGKSGFQYSSGWKIFNNTGGTRTYTWFFVYLGG